MKIDEFEFDQNIIAYKTILRNQFATNYATNKNLKSTIYIFKKAGKIISNKLSKILVFLKNFLPFILFMFYIFLYDSSLFPCLEDESVCMLKIEFYYSIFYKVVYSSIFLGLLFFLILKNIVGKIHILYISLSLIFFYFKDHQDNLIYHGQYNLYGLTLFTVLFFFILNVIYKFISSLFKKKYYIILIIFILFSTLLYKLKINFDVLSKCDKWEYGLNNTKIDNNQTKYSCKIKKPKICKINYTNRFSYLKYINKFIKCKRRKEIEKHSLRGHNKFVTGKTKRIGLPITSNNPKFRTDKIFSNKKMYKNFLSNLIDMDNEKQLKLIPDKFKPEVIVNYNKNPYGEIEINLKFNSSLSEERKKKENLNSLYKNVLFIFIDGISRPQFPKLLPKTSNFLKKFLQYKGYSFKSKVKENNFHGFEFLKYHAMHSHTIGNEQPMLYGRKYNEDNGYNINKYFKENGYITMFIWKNDNRT